ncbi:hepatic lectin-like [Branchiostoma floridae]|nr:hepatic lectin-like [Branchiostoma floridae]
MTDKASWSTASSRCKQQGAILASVNNHGENNFIGSLISNARDRRLVPSYWLGLTKESGWWKWTDGSRVVYTNWAEGEPSNSMLWSLGQGENCGSMYTKTGKNIGWDPTRHTGQWNDNKCSSRFPYVCEKPI